MRTKHPFLRSVFYALAAVLALWAFTVAEVLLAGARSELRPADAIMVLGAAQYNGHPSPVLRARLDYAIDLWRAGWAPRLVMTGGIGRRDTLSEAEVARRYAVARGVPDSVVYAEKNGVSSALSMRDAAAIMRGLGMHRALVVSDAFHMLRLELLALRSGIRPYAAPTPMSRIEADPDARWRYVLRESIAFPPTALLGGR
ncbi:MAG TPA: YdcF family protein [Longimicrobiales bacterium]